MTAPHGTNRSVTVGALEIANDRPFTLIAGPCAMESRDHAYDMAGSLKALCAELGIGLIYKSSFDKANRTSSGSPRGIGLEAAMAVFADLRRDLDLPVLTDVHEAAHCAELKGVVDVIQIPAFLCRQTDLLIAAGESGLAVNVKKGQFLAPWDMANVAAKIAGTGNERVMLCERGASFGYNTLVSDMRGLPIMARTGFPVVFDATHSVQQPGGQGTTSGGQREFAPVLARAAIAVGVAAVFMETHQAPDTAPSDGPNMIPLDQMRDVLETRADPLAESAASNSTRSVALGAARANADWPQ
ncbi:MAG: 3-deoxy-8-phosphooctulonate synthase, partial [Rhodospirillales bacterium]